MKRLILGELPENFNSDNDVVLSVASFLGNESKLDESKKYFEIFDNHIKKTQVLDEACALADQQIDLLAQYLNKKYHLNQSKDFWKIILSPFVHNFCQFFLEKYYRLFFFIEVNKHETFRCVLLEKNEKINLDKSVNSYWLVQTHEFNHWVFSWFYKKIAPVHWSHSIISEKLRYEVPLAAQEDTREIVRWVKSKLRVREVYGVSKAESILLSFILKFLPKKKHLLLQSSASRTIDYPDIFKSAEFHQILIELLPAEFDLIPRYIAEKPKWCTGKIRITGPAFYFDLKLQVELATAHENGEYIFTSQHGGGYGRFYLVDYLREIETLFHGFLSWGWVAHDRFVGNIQPLPSPYLSKYYNRHERKNDSIIMVGTKCDPNIQRLEYSFEPSHMLQYRIRKRVLINKLSEKVKDNFYYRPYPELKFYFEDFAYQQRHIPLLKKHTGNLHSDMLACNLLILDHAQTTFNLAMAMNVPMLYLEEGIDWEVSPYAIPHMEELERVGIVYRDPLKLAQFVNENLGSIQDWWYSPELQSARENWLFIHARCSNRWLVDWIKFFWSY